MIVHKFQSILKFAFLKNVLPLKSVIQDTYWERIVSSMLDKHKYPFKLGLIVSFL